MNFRGAALLIGLWDLFIHSLALCVLIFMFGRTQESIHDSNEIASKLNVSQPFMEINAKNFYAHLNLATIKWIQSLSQRRNEEKNTISISTIQFVFFSRRSIYRFFHHSLGNSYHFSTYFRCFKRIRINFSIQMPRLFLFFLEQTIVSSPVLSH